MPCLEWQGNNARCGKAELDPGMSPCDPPIMTFVPTRHLLVPRLVAVAFVTAVLVLAVASWDIARGRAPDTTSALIADLLQTPENRRCSRDATDVVARYFPVGMTRAAAALVLDTATIATPHPWFWTPKNEDAVTDTGAALGFTRTIRYTAFGNQKVTGEVAFENGLVGSVGAKVVCAFG